MSNTNTIAEPEYYDWDENKSKSSQNEFYHKIQSKEFVWKQNNISKIETAHESWSSQLEDLKNSCCCCPVATLLILLIGGFLYMLIRPNVPTQIKHICVHDQFIQGFPSRFDQPLKQSPIEATLNHEKQLRNKGIPGNWIPIRVQVDYNNLQGKISSDLLKFISLKLIPPAISFLQTAYLVYPQGDLRITNCHDKIKLANIYSIGVQDVDLQIFATASFDQVNWIARAGPCYFSDITGRPIAGILEFNQKYLRKLNLGAVSNAELTNWIQTLIHEFTHILGFSKSLFHTYVDPNNNQISGLRRVVAEKDKKEFIVLPLIRKLVQQYFDCDQAFGALLEDGESDGSHWEKSTFGNEAMTAQQIDNPSYSIFTFTLMESTGWYLPNYKKAEPFFWGRGAGCEITTGHCFQKQQCNFKKYETCNFDHSGIGKCSLDQYSRPCWYQNAESQDLCKQEYHELNKIIGGYTGVDSRCFESTLANSFRIENLRAICLKTYCKDNKPTFYVGDKGYLCNYPGQKINVEHKNSFGIVICPNEYFCEQTRNCKNDCSGAGTCRQTTCDCWKGYYGEDCSEKE